MKTIMQAIINKAIASNRCQGWSLVQAGLFKLPYGNMQAMAEQATNAGFNVTQACNDWCLINNAVWLSKHGMVRKHKTS